jgi:hypothetical protein
MSKSKASSARSSSAGAWVVRGILFAVLAVMVVVAIKEFGARRQASASHAAVAELIAKAGENNAVLKSQIKPLIQGTPKLESVDPKSIDSPLLATAERYTWPGLLRTYSLTIGYSLGGDPEVEVVEGGK